MTRPETSGISSLSVLGRTDPYVRTVSCTVSLVAIQVRTRGAVLAGGFWSIVGPVLIMIPIVMKPATTIAMGNRIRLIMSLPFIRLC